MTENESYDDRNILPECGKIEDATQSQDVKLRLDCEKSGTLTLNQSTEGDVMLDSEK